MTTNYIDTNIDTDNPRTPVALVLMVALGVGVWALAIMEVVALVGGAR